MSRRCGVPTTAGALALAILPAEQARLAGVRQVNPEAYEAYLRAREHSYQFTRASFDSAQHYYELALEKDPKYALAYAGLSFLWAARQQMNLVPTAIATPNMKRTAEQALALDANLADAHYVLAVIKFVTDWDWAGADAEFKAAVALNPNLAEARWTYSHLLTILKRPREAMEQIDAALRLDPLNPELLAFYGQDLLMLRRYDEAGASELHAIRTAAGSSMCSSNVASFRLCAAAIWTKYASEVRAGLVAHAASRGGGAVATNPPASRRSLSAASWACSSV
jgi:tetratricopeptide (TPR) repeat protein